MKVKIGLYWSWFAKIIYANVKGWNSRNKLYK